MTQEGEFTPMTEQTTTLHHTETRRLPPLLLLLAALLGAAFLWLAHITTTPPVRALNEELLRRAAALREPALDAAMLVITRLGNPWVVAAVLVLLGLLLLWLRRWAAMLGVALAGGGALLLTEGLKFYYGRARPAVVPTPLDLGSYSFPSAHALGSMVGYGVLLIVGLWLARRLWQRWLLGVALPALILLIGASRVYFGVHFVTDVVAGFVVGLAWLLVSVGVVGWVEQWRARRVAG
jgi:undecaprenyl-diphosphatase